MRSQAAQASVQIHYGTTRRTHSRPEQEDRSGQTLAATIRDLMLIALAWAIFIGLMVYPVAQIIGIAACAVALLVGGVRRPTITATA